MEEAAKILNSKKEGVVVMSSSGTVEFSNTGLVRLLGWTCQELQGENVKVLMPDKSANAHDGFLQRYAEKSESAERQGKPVISDVVGSGRDGIAKHKNGEEVRAFLAVVRLDRDSGSLHDCLFLGLMTRIAGPVKGAIVSTQASRSAKDASPSDARYRSRSRSRSTVGPSLTRQSTASTAWSRTPKHKRHSQQISPRVVNTVVTSVSANSHGSMRSMLSHQSHHSRVSRNSGQRASIADMNVHGFAKAMHRQKCSVMVVHLVGVQNEENIVSLNDDYGLFLAMLYDECAKAKGYVQYMIGDTAICTFNAAIPNTSH